MRAAPILLHALPLTAAGFTRIGHVLAVNAGDFVVLERAAQAVDGDVVRWERSISVVIPA